MADALTLAAAIADGHVYARDVMAASLARAGQVPGVVVRMLPEEDALRAADVALDGIFCGVPFLGKDLGSAAKGLGVAAGCPALKARVRDPDRDSALFAGFRASGLVPFGLTAVPEFGLALTTEPRDTPPVANPFNAALSAGGSSGGAACAVASGIVAIAHATDAAGSIRVPAACCGLWGLKPSRGVVPVGPDFGNHLMGLASELVLARSLRDVVAAFESVAIVGADTTSEALKKIAVCIPAGCDTRTQKAVLDVAKALAQKGHELVDCAAPATFAATADQLARVILSVSLAEWVDAVGLNESDLTPIVRAIADDGRAMSGTEMFAASRDIARLTHEIHLVFGDADALLMPVLSGPPPALGSFPDDETSTDARFASMARMAPMASLANVCGLPALAFPAGFENGLPIGAQLVGRRGADADLLALAEPLAHHVRIPFPAAIAGLPS